MDHQTLNYLLVQSFFLVVIRPGRAFYKQSEQLARLPRELVSCIINPSFMSSDGTDSITLYQHFHYGPPCSAKYQLFHCGSLSRFAMVHSVSTVPHKLRGMHTWQTRTAVLAKSSSPLSSQKQTESGYDSKFSSVP